MFGPEINILVFQTSIYNSFNPRQSFRNLQYLQYMSNFFYLVKRVMKHPMYTHNCHQISFPSGTVKILM